MTNITYPNFSVIFKAFLIDFFIFLWIVWLLFGDTIRDITWWLVFLGNIWYYLFYWKTTWFENLWIILVDEIQNRKPNLLKLIIRYLLSIRWAFIAVIIYIYYVKTFLINWWVEPSFFIVRFLAFSSLFFLLCSCYMFFNVKKQSLGEKLTWTVTILFNKKAVSTE